MNKFYITTAIDYVNAEPHIGHAYQKVIADILTRWNNSFGKDTFFLTGTDEHGQKLADVAKENKITPKELADKNSLKFKKAWEFLNIKPNRFIRTTDKDHIKTVQEITKKIHEKGDIYKGLNDLNITRLNSNLTWGIPFPIDDKFTTYVWWDALINYLSGIDYPNKKFSKYWPADVHLLGKDNGWFHAVIWPAILMSADIKLPKTVFIHGFLTFNKQKISKSLGNSIDPVQLGKKYGVDSIRYFLVREIPFYDDGNFSEESLKNRVNNELANELGNLISRTLTLSKKLPEIK